MKERQEEAKRKKVETAKQAETKRCHLHAGKPKNSCKFCKRYQEFVDAAKKEEEAAQSAASSSGRRGEGFQFMGKLEIANTKTYGFTPLLQSHVAESQHYKQVLQMDTFEEIVEEARTYIESVKPYQQNSNTVPTPMVVVLYRLFTMGIDARQLQLLVDMEGSPYVRCLGFLFVRIGLHPEELLPWLSEYMLDGEEFFVTKDQDSQRLTISEFLEQLLRQDTYFSTIIPRIPAGKKRQIEQTLATLPQCRKRTRANQEIIKVFEKEDVKVEVLENGEWLAGRTVELLDDASSRIKVRVSLDDGTEVTAQIGRVIITDRRFDDYSSRGADVDWSREKGKTEKELVEELRSKEREKAVCASGKEAPKRIVGFKNMCALPREMGKESFSLMESETFVSDRYAQKRSRSPTKEEEQFRKAPSAEHQARMQQLFEKYGNQKAVASGGAKGPDIEGPDTMRLG